MKNTDYKDVFDIGNEALSMENKFSFQTFPSIKNAFATGENIRGMSNVSPLATVKLFNQSTDDILKKYYPDGNISTNGNTNIIEDINITVKNKYKFSTYNYYFDNNRNSKYGDEGDLLAFKLLLFVSNDGNKVRECYEIVQPKDDEVILFLESDSGELSKDVLFGKMSAKVRKQFTDDQGNLKSNLFDNEIMKAVLKNTDSVNQEIVEELMKNGYIKESKIKNGFFSLLRYIMLGVSAPAKALGWVLKKLGNGVDFLKISDNFWDTEIEGYFFKKDKLIDIFTIPTEKLQYFRNLFTDKKGFNFADITPVFLEDLILNQLNKIEKLINNYNNYIKAQIEKFFAPHDPSADSVKDNLIENIALLCGIWNGLVDFVASTLKFFGSLLEAPFDISKDFQHTLEMIDNFWDMLDMTLLENLWEAVKDGAKKIKEYLTSKNDDLNWVRINYITGFTISFIGTFFIPIADIAKVSEIGKMGKILTKINSEIGKEISQTVKFVKIQTAKAYQKVSNALENLILLFKEGGKELQNFVNNLWKKIADWFLKNKDAVKPYYEEITNLTSKELDWMASKNIGNLGGNILKETQIRKLRGTLKNKGLTLIVDGDINSITKLYKPVGGFKTFEDLMLFMKSSIPPKVGMFSAETGQLILTKECTEIVAFHEICHLKHFEEVGAEAYRGYNRLTKEMYVWKQIIAQRGRWTEAELNDALNYINRVRVNEYGLKPLKIK
ncbi:zincin-like metallopeptidase toxin domain-containing protein [Chryseobacterium sp. c4a]|uniref:zincin-like metallopeptidase toxin domain-containing protein n=1 Tax=Chryseobacterium sp. c4a TaxID=1573582 RepID=UPI001623657C|nr:zincin-like metallopeptidase toxin domain-containing protein [Chryseobacterium sp. c4a]